MRSEDEQESAGASGLVRLMLKGKRDRGPAHAWMAILLPGPGPRTGTGRPQPPPLLCPRVTQWPGKQITDGSPELADRLACRTLRRSVRAGWPGRSYHRVVLSRRDDPPRDRHLLPATADGAADRAIYGRDPEDPARAAEILVFRRRHQPVAEAEAALHSAGRAKSRHRQPPWTHRTWIAIKQLPQMIALEVRRIKHPLGVLIWAAGAAAFFVPLKSIPVWTYATRVCTKRLGRAGIERSRQTPAGVDPTITLPKPPTARVRRRLVVSPIGLIAALAILASFIPLGKVSHFLPLGGIVLAEVGLLWTGLKLMPIPDRLPQIGQSSLRPRMVTHRSVER
jgi:hypothetical protein